MNAVSFRWYGVYRILTVEELAQIYQQRLGGKPDLCCYWFERARTHIADGKCQRVGLLATQGIRGGTNRNVLKAIKRTGDIFFAESDRPWILSGANVHISMVGFDDGTEKNRIIDGKAVSDINPNLTIGADTTCAIILNENSGISFQGAIKRGSFDIPSQLALTMLKKGGNPHGKPNSDVIVPYVNGIDVTRQYRDMWIINFRDGYPKDQASLYETPFEHLLKNVRAEREATNQQKSRDEWWLHWCTRSEMTEKIINLPRFIVTARVAKHRIFAWLSAPSYVDCQLIAFARSDDYFFGVLHSRIHEVWALMQGTQLESRPRYTPTTCFETFPMPRATAEQREVIAAAARELNELRNNWLKPPEWVVEEILEFPGSLAGPWAHYVTGADNNGIGTVRYPRLVPRDAGHRDLLAKRTLTNLYNERPAWLDNVHRKLDAAVYTAYGWDPDISDDELLSKLLALNLERAAEEKT